MHYQELRESVSRTERGCSGTPLSTGSPTDTLAQGSQGVIVIH